LLPSPIAHGMRIRNRFRVSRRDATYGESAFDSNDIADAVEAHPLCGRTVVDLQEDARELRMSVRQNGNCGISRDNEAHEQGGYRSRHCTPEG
jgi:hypothetical protein